MNIHLIAILLLNLAALIFRHFVAHLLRHGGTAFVRDLLQLLLLDVAAVVVGVVCTATGYRGPHLGKQFNLLHFNSIWTPIILDFDGKRKYIRSEVDRNNLLWVESS